MVETNRPKLAVVENGGVASAKGVHAGGIHAGFRKNPQRLDLALVEFDQPVAAAGTFTTNKFCAAPVTVSREHLGADGGAMVRAVCINSGNANAATGDEGLDAAARAIMTTDTHPKERAVSYEATGALAGHTITVGGMCKGSGMIMPNMATMICIVTTDAPVTPAALHEVLLSTVKATFNKVTVDSDTSTNDTCIALATGSAAPDAPAIEPGTPEADELAYAIHDVCQHLAREIAADGEGAPPPTPTPTPPRAPSPTRRWSRRPSTVTTATGAASPWRSASAACRSTSATSISTSWACQSAATASPWPSTRTRPCAASTSRRSRFGPTSVPAPARRPSGPVTSPTSTSRSTESIALKV